MNTLSPFQTYFIVLADYSHLKHQRPGDCHAIPGDITTSKTDALDQFISAYRDALEYAVPAPRAYAWHVEHGTSTEVTDSFRAHHAAAILDLDEAAADLAKQTARDQAGDRRYQEHRDRFIHEDAWIDAAE